MKNVGKLVFATLILTAMISSVAASPAELNIFPEQSSTEINSFTSYQVEVKNNGPVSDVYYMSSSSSEVTIAPNRVPETGVLEPGESQTVNVWYNPDQDKEAGVYSFSMTAKSRATGKKYSTDATVEVIKDHQVDVEVADSKTGCLGEQVIYSVNVTNDGIQTETFKLTTRYGELSQKEVTLQPEETQEVTLVASSDEEIQKNFNVIAASKTSYAQDIENVQFNTETCYASQVSITPQQQDIAAMSGAEYEVTVRNTGTKADTFTLSTNIGELNDTELEVEGESSKSTTLTVEPEETGQKTISVAAEGQSKSQGTAQMNVYNGMDARVDFAKQSNKVCESEQFNLEANITNTGAASETFQLSTSRGNLSDAQVTLDQGESETVEVTVNSTPLEKGRHGVNLTAEATTFGQPVKSASTDVVVQNCWDISMNVVPKVASAGENRSVIYEVFLTNNGTKENTYQLSHEGPDWVNIKPEEVTVAPGQKAKAYMYAGIPFQKKGEVQITANAQGTEVSASETVKLLIGKEIQEAIESDKNNGPTGGFADRLPSTKVDLGGNLGKIAASLIIGLLITAGVLYREW